LANEEELKAAVAKKKKAKDQKLLKKDAIRKLMQDLLPYIWDASLEKLIMTPSKFMKLGDSKAVAEIGGKDRLFFGGMNIGNNDCTTLRTRERRAAETEAEAKQRKELKKEYDATPERRETQRLGQLLVGNIDGWEAQRAYYKKWYHTGGGQSWQEEYRERKQNMALEAIRAVLLSDIGSDESAEAMQELQKYADIRDLKRLKKAQDKVNGIQPFDALRQCNDMLINSAALRAMMKLDDVAFYTSLNNINSKTWPFQKEAAKNINSHDFSDATKSELHQLLKIAIPVIESGKTVELVVNKSFLKCICNDDSKEGYHNAGVMERAMDDALCMQLDVKSLRLNKMKPGGAPPRTMQKDTTKNITGVTLVFGGQMKK
jgi:hypothetical protein